MKIMKNYKEVSEFLGCKFWEVEEADNRYMGRKYLLINDIELFKHIKAHEIHYVKVNLEDDLDCKEYMMTYEIHEYTWKVYVDNIEGWQECNVIDINNTRLGIDRAIVLTTTGAQLNRRVKFVIDEEDEDFKPDGCIYFMEKE